MNNQNENDNRTIQFGNNINPNSNSNVNQPNMNLQSGTIQNSPNYNQQMNNYQNQNNGFQNQSNDIPLNEINKDKKKVSQIITTIIGIIVFVVAFLIFSGKLNFNLFSKYDNIKNGSSIVQLGELKVNLPNYFQLYKNDSQYKIYKSDDDKCFVSIMTSPSTAHKNIDAIIDTILNGSANELSAKVGSYSIKTQEINSNTWSNTYASLNINRVYLSEYIFAILRNNNYYVIQYQITNYDSTCSNSLKFK